MEVSLSIKLVDQPSVHLFGKIIITCHLTGAPPHKVSIFLLKGQGV